MSRKNIDSYNILKGISIYLVVCIHIVYKFFTPDSKPFLFEIWNYLTGFAVPFFLILGGFFFGKKFPNNDSMPFTKEDFYKSIINVFKRIVIPYYVFVIILTLYNSFMGKNIFWKHFLFVDSNEHGLYFLIIYTYSFIFSLSTFFVLRNMPKMLISTSIAISSFIFFVITSNFNQIDSVVFYKLPLISFFCCGILMYFIVSHFDSKVTQLQTSIFLVVAIIVFTGIIYIARKIYGPFPVITSSPPTIFRLIYCLLAFWLSLSLLSKEVIATFFKKVGADRFGEQSMFIFLIHAYFIKATIPIILYSYSYLSLDYNNNLFIIPVIIIAYIITFLSYRSYYLLPQNIRTLFS